MRCVVDASVAAKWFAPEDDSPVTFGILDHELLAPDLLYAEVANILWKKGCFKSHAIGVCVQPG